MKEKTSNVLPVPRAAVRSRREQLRERLETEQEWGERESCVRRHAVLRGVRPSSEWEDRRGRRAENTALSSSWDERLLDSRVQALRSAGPSRMIICDDLVCLIVSTVDLIT